MLLSNGLRRHLIKRKNFVEKSGMHLMLEDLRLIKKITINGKLIFSPDKKTLTYGAKSLKIGSSAAYCFELLLLKKGGLVYHEELYEYAWRRFGMEPTTASLYQNISNLRKSLREITFMDECIITMPRRGFSINTSLDIKIEDTDSFKIVESAESAESAESVSFNNSDRTKHLTKLKKCHDSEIGSIDEKKINRGKVYLKFIYICVTGVTLVLTFNFLYSLMNKKNIAIYERVYSNKGCNFFINSDAGANLEEVYKYIPKENKFCNVGKYIFITAYRSSDRYSVFECKFDINKSLKTECISSYYSKGFFDEKQN